MAVEPGGVTARVRFGDGEEETIPRSSLRHRRSGSDDDEQERDSAAPSADGERRPKRARFAPDVFEAEPATQERVVLAFGQLLILGTLTAGLLGFTLVHDGAIACRVGGEVAAGGANASAAAPVLACDDFW